MLTCLQDSAAAVPLGLHSMHSSCRNTRQLADAGLAEAAAATLPLGWHRGEATGLESAAAWHVLFEQQLCKSTDTTCTWLSLLVRMPGTATSQAAACVTRHRTACMRSVVDCS